MLREINLASIGVRVLLALLIGGILGMERGIRNRPAGFRTYMLVCLGSALVMMTNQYAAEQFGLSDPVRMGAQVVSGIGFLGAGTIILTGKSQVRGITTAAGLWAAACCGLAIGIGFYEGAIAGGLVILIVMSLFQRADNRIRQRSRTMELYLEIDNQTPFSSFIEYCRANELEIYDIQMQKNKMVKDMVSSIILTAKNRKKMTHNEVIELMSAGPGVRYIEELQ